MVLEIDNVKKRLRTKKAGNGSRSLMELSKKESTKGSTPKEYLTIDHPQNGEKIQPRHYAIRIGAGGGASVEISIDKNEWRPCRYTAGYYWFDWHSIPLGNHQIVARMKLPTNTFKKSKIVRCEVIE